MELPEWYMDDEVWSALASAWVDDPSGVRVERLAEAYRAGQP